jgi:hypothetical protein
LSTPAEPLPTLELPSQALMQWSQMALLLAAQLAQRREHLDRLAWSDSEHAAREHDLAQLRDTLQPAVRAMTAQEIAHWPTRGSQDATSTTGLVTAQVAPLNGRWALHASARDEDDTVSHTWVSCRAENLARDLASEIVVCGQPEALHRLDAHLQLADQAATQHAHAQAQVRAGVVVVDRDVMAAQVRSAWPPDAAAAVLTCQAWPTLADKLAAAGREGHDLTALLGGISTGGLPGARKPAALASWLLDNRVIAAGRATGDGGQGHWSPPGASPHPHHDQIVAWVDQLDPASMIDRVGALGVLGYYGTGVDTRLITLFPDLLTDATPDAATAGTAEGLAGDRERSAAAHQASVDDPTTVRREDLDGQALAGRDLHEAAAARATAAHHQGAAHAAVARAAVTLTPPSPVPTGPAPAPTPPSPLAQPAGPARTLRQGR